MLRQLVALSRGQWRVLAAGSVFLLLGGAMGLFFPQLVREIIDRALGAEPDLDQINQVVLVMLAVFAIQGAAIAGRFYLFSIAGERIVTDLRRRLYERLIVQEVGFFDRHRTGELTNRLASDTATLQNAASVNISMGLRHAVSALGGVGLLLFTSPALTGTMLLIVPPVMLGAVIVGRKIRRFARAVQDALARASEVAEETLSGLRTVRAHAREHHEAGRYGRATEDAFALARRRSGVSAVFIGVTSFAAYAAIAVVLWRGSQLVVEGGMSVGELTSFVLYTLIVAFAIGSLAGLWSDFMRAIGAAERIFELMAREPEIPLEEGRVLERVEGALRFEAVTFAYPSRPDVVVLDEVSFEVAPGEVVALVGPSGSGKSTIANLLLRFYDPRRGRVLLDGVDLRELNARALRESIGVVAQTPVLFSSSVGDNIRYGRLDASDEAVADAARIANAHDFIVTFPGGYRTAVGERGVQLSGGQRQRVAIARAVLKDPRVLILDEATSALDAESEHLVQEALERLMRGRTTLIIAHRLSTVMGADRVLVVDQGQIVEQGPHAELVARDGLYRRLVERQFVALSGPPS